MEANQNPLIEELQSLRASFDKTTEKLIKDIQRHEKIMAKSDKRQQQEYDELQRKFAEVASLQQEIEETQKEVIFTMGAIGESRSKETGNHVRRVAEYSKLIALHYGLPKEEAEMLKQASPMHDIGKVAIEDAILNKPAKLTEEEFNVMKHHTELGYDMLKHSHRPLLQMAAIVAYEHHEKYNGKGYPRGLKGTDIHIYGRITAFADVFDALGNSRCYKPAWEDEKIFKLFQEERGQHFDPKIVDIFFRHLDDFLLIRQELIDTMEPLANSIPTK